MEKTNNVRVVREYSTIHKANPERIFPLLCPVREYEWIPSWRCELIFSQSGVAELGCVFRTDFSDQYGPETWVVSHYQPVREIAFVRTGSLRTTRYEVILAANREGAAITWRQEITGLTDQGNALVAGSTNDQFLATMVPLNEMLAHYLETGESLSLLADVVETGGTGQPR
jgi:hypothetical protein